MKRYLILLLLAGCLKAKANLADGIGMSNVVPPAELYDSLSAFDGGCDSSTVSVPGGCYSLQFIVANEGTGTGAAGQIHTILANGTDVQLAAITGVAVDAGSIVNLTPSSSGSFLTTVAAPGTGKGNLQTYGGFPCPVLPKIRLVVPASAGAQYRCAILCSK
jgi:hypothetical protein